MINKIRKLNPKLVIKNIEDDSFKKYGKIIKNYDFKNIIDYVEKKTEIPRQGNKYEAKILELDKLAIKKRIEEDFYGEMLIEIGYCNGKNSSLNGLEYHKGAEINIAITNLILLLGQVQDIQEGTYDAKQVEAFYLPKGTAIEIYSTTLHYAPCKVEKRGFKSVVILPAGTNLPLNKQDKKKDNQDLLFAKNKWLLVHPSRNNLVEQGAKAGILGENIRIKIN
ncbi:DUF4867 family protein [Iocasia frigidifontis]|uniref:DUF4867 family protein n=1 Tax=Iocasia fonsfrigidae TaxID=2682810 RepID=A0A8A7KPN2_9FIRM|nr:DUF4867 family protein [Iocasia fonsfrigidae]QTL99762.1 DUF4867 family protein [Iocasia fonsfrigidae]